MKPLVIHSRISQADFVRVSLSLGYRTPVGALIRIAALCLLAFFPEFDLEHVSFIWPAIAVVGSLLLRGFYAVRKYQANPALAKPVVYTFGENLHVATDGKEGRLELSDFAKVRKTRRWLFLYQSYPRKATSFISLRDVSEEQLQHLKKLLDQAGTKNNL